jgi:metallo-beta-lactamase family protein
VLFVGYQARGTLGRQILDGAPQVRVLGQMHPVRARVLQIHGFSAHADRSELLRWAQPLAAKPPRRVFVTHGEPEVAGGFAAALRAQWKLDTSVPAYGDEVALE